MSRILAFLAALLLVLSCLIAAADQPAVPVDALGGTSWLNPEGVEFHFTGDAALFFSFDPAQTMYRRIDAGLYMTTPATDVGGPYIVADSARLCTFILDNASLLVDDLADEAGPLPFTYVNHSVELAGTRWQNEYGEPFVFSEDCAVFSNPLTITSYARTSTSIGAYYEISFGPNGEMYYEPDRPCALLWDGSFLRLYTSRDGQSALWLTFTPISE